VAVNHNLSSSSSIAHTAGHMVWLQHSTTQQASAHSSVYQPHAG
jgi:hypothetical protein